MFSMFIIGMLAGASLLALGLVVFNEKPSAFKVAVVALLLTIWTCQWKIADEQANFQKQYQAISGGRGDGL